MSDDLDSILGTNPHQQPASPSPSSPQAPSVGSAGSGVSKQVSALMKRYRDAYLVARATVSIGTTIKAIGFILGILIALGGILLGSNMRGDTGFAAMVLAILIGGFVLLQFYIFGVLVSAQGQTLKASLDSAVNNSPFLENEQRAKVMSLPES
jgi:hypothetical protein